MTKLIHGIDLNAPGGLARLFDFHRATFGDAVMEDGAGGNEPKPGGDPKSGGDDGGDGGDSGKAGGDPNPAGDGDGDEKLGEPGKKALKAEREAHAKAKKELADANKKLQEIEDAKLSDTQRAEKEKNDAIARAEKAERETWRLAALADHPVSKENRDLVVGTDEASYLASAKRISEMEAAAAGKKGRKEPVPDSGRRSADNGAKAGTIAEHRQRIAAAKTK
ncbi:hypothetical protein [Zhihengliuella halotolerans]|uniref:hypothetical protein n=1 Tax=Zhihengliuella halotolerans TaxID=370736 RepID=UPI000C80017C|nr:hypothetical protein [Zhihengliuella halotolerans]